MAKLATSGAPNIVGMPDTPPEHLTGGEVIDAVPGDHGPRWIEYRDLDAITYTPDNPKHHDQAGIAASVNRQGYVDPVIIDERTSLLVSGHGRCDDLKARRGKGEAPPDGIVVTPEGRWRVPVYRGWASRSDADARAYVVGANQLTTAGGWENPVLADWLTGLAEEPEGLAGTGFDDDDLAILMASLADDGSGDGEGGGGGGGEDESGLLLAIADVTVGDPSITPEVGSVWRLGGHVLVVADVMTGHHLWGPFLTADPGDGADVVFCPYAGPFVALADKLDAVSLVLVQPDPYIAGHIIDKWSVIHGAASVVAA